jgi:predicted small integral membrane protein
MMRHSRDFAMLNSHVSYVLAGPFVTNTANQLCGVNEKRIALAFANEMASALWLSPDNPNVAAGSGLALPVNTSSQSYLFLNIFDHGPIVRKAWHGLIASANWKVLVIETIVDECVFNELFGSPGPGY